ncbi:MAG: hypothetical protein K0S63_942, partial [Gammaproteobacteria bacterium]|nr:hypothetical protein [Gammaproteobacteria bacterium]
MKEKKLLTNKQGEVRELTAKDIRAMRSASEILPKKLLAVLPKPKRKRGAVSVHALIGKVRIWPISCENFIKMCSHTSVCCA